MGWPKPNSAGPSAAGRTWSSRRSPGSGSARSVHSPAAMTARTSLPQPGSTPLTNSVAPPSSAACGQPLDPLRRCVTRVVERVQRRRDDMLACAQAPLDVLERLVGADVAGRHVGDGVAAGEYGLNVGGRRNARFGVEPANVAASLPFLSGDDVMTPDSRKPGNATADRIAVAPILPVPHTATRSTRPPYRACSVTNVTE